MIDISPRISIPIGDSEVTVSLREIVQHEEMWRAFEASRRPAKQALRRGTSSPGRPCTYREVLGALQSDDTRRAAMASYRAAGFTADDFATRRQARMAMLEALVSTEDALEPTRRHAEREAVRAVRRRLEIEVWP